jgi:hypothetical protein
VPAPIEECRHPKGKRAAALAGLGQQLALHQIEAFPHRAESSERPGHHNFDALVETSGQQPPGPGFKIVGFHRRETFAHILQKLGIGPVYPGPLKRPRFYMRDSGISWPRKCRNSS